MPSVFLGVAFGRLGCFLNGCCYGDRCELPWAVTFPLGSVPDMALVQRGFIAPDATHVFALHPTQIYSSLDGLVLFLLTSAYFHYRHRDGAVVALGALSYAVTRFAMEFLRGDEMGQFNTTLTISQWISIGIFLAGLVYLAWLNRRPATTAPPTGIRPRISAA
jgi:phosphatidylglycerol:prolipoprotein diacylglycerol transferase